MKFNHSTLLFCLVTFYKLTTTVNDCCSHMKIDISIHMMVKEKLLFYSLITYRN